MALAIQAGKDELAVALYHVAGAVGGAGDVADGHRRLGEGWGEPQIDMARYRKHKHVTWRS